MLEPRPPLSIEEKQEEEAREARLLAAEQRAEAEREAEEATKLRQEAELAAIAAAEAKEEERKRLNREKQARFKKRMQEGKAAKVDDRFRHQPIPRPTEAEINTDRLQNFPAHIAAHAILASVYGESYDAFHDNEYRLEADGAVRCSLRLKEGGHQRIFVHVPDEVKLAVVGVENRQMEVDQEAHQRTLEAIKSAATAEEIHQASLLEAEMLSKMNAAEQDAYYAAKAA